MDRKSDKKLTKYLGAYLVFAVLFSVFLLALERHYVTNELQRVLFLLAEHPELETEIVGLWGKNDQREPANFTTTDAMITAMETIEEKYGYRLQRAADRSFWGFWCAGMLLSLIHI